MLSRFFKPHSKNLQKEIWGLRFKNIIGLGAGFDKNALYMNELEALGFGFVEIGTVTPQPQSGNEKPRLFRLKKDKALVNRMGFNNEGVKIIAARLKAWKERNDFLLQTPDSRLIIGGNIGKNKSTTNEDAFKDYETCFKQLFDYVDYFVVNVSSPNTPGLRELQEKDSLRKILNHLNDINTQQPLQKPVLLKIAPDLSYSQIDDIIELAMDIKLSGLVVTNTTISRENLRTKQSSLTAIGNGGLSGKPLHKKSTDLCRHIYMKSKGTIPLMASGGIFTASDANEKLKAGASLIQVWTGFIYEGPSIIKRICNALHNKPH